MPRYYFTIRSFEQEYEDERCAVLQDVDAALDYACRMVRDLSISGYNDPGLLVSVRNEMREIVLSVPFLAACAKRSNSFSFSDRRRYDSRHPLQHDNGALQSAGPFQK